MTDNLNLAGSHCMLLSPPLYFANPPRLSRWPTGDLMTVNLNLAGLPAVTLPCGFTTEGGATLPVGIQMVGRPFGEAALLQTAHVFEQTAAGFARGQPQVYAG